MQDDTPSQAKDSTTYQRTGAMKAPGGAVATERAGNRTDEPESQRLTTDRPVQSGAVGTQPPPTAAPAHPDTPDHRADDEVTMAAGPRPRTSLLATFSLIFGVAGALFVLTGTLAGYGIALGAIAVLLSFAGLSATSRRHVAGKADAMLGLLLGLGAVGVGVLAVTGQFAWPNLDADTVQRFRDWLDAQTVDRF